MASALISVILVPVKSRRLCSSKKMHLESRSISRFGRVSIGRFVGCRAFHGGVDPCSNHQAGGTKHNHNCRGGTFFEEDKDRKQQSNTPERVKPGSDQQGSFS
jgi:hypothetical protein